MQTRDDDNNESTTGTRTETTSGFSQDSDRVIAIHNGNHKVAIGVGLRADYEENVGGIHLRFLAFDHLYWVQRTGLLFLQGMGIQQLLGSGYLSVLFEPRPVCSAVPGLDHVVLVELQNTGKSPMEILQLLIGQNKKPVKADFWK